MENNATIIALSGKGGVGKTSISAAIVKLLVEAYPDKKILAIDADPAVGLSTALGIDVKTTIDDIRKEIVATVEDGNTKAAIELLGDARYKIFDALVETDGFAFIAVGRPESAGCYCKINAYLKEVISILSSDFDYVILYVMFISSSMAAMTTVLKPQTPASTVSVTSVIDNVSKY